MIHLWLKSEVNHPHDPARCKSQVLLVQNFDRNVTKGAPRKALKSIAWGKLTSDERIVLHRVELWDSVNNQHGIIHGILRHEHWEIP